MPINPANSDHHGSGNYVIIVWCPTVVGERFVHFGRNPTTGAWAIRDYVTGWQLSNHHSPLTIQQIEDDSQRDEFPAFHPHTRTQDWEAYLRLRSMAVSRQQDLSYSTAPPPMASGAWQPL